MRATQARALEDFCERLFVGPLAFCAGTLRFDPAPDCRPMSDLTQPAVFAALIDCYARDHPGADRMAVVSFWSQIFFAQLLMPITVLCLAAEQPLPIDVGDPGVRFCPAHGIPLSFHFGCGAPASPGTALVQAIYEEHVASLVAIFKRQSGLAARLFWENAGSYGIWALGEIARTRPGAGPAAEALLRDDAWPRGACLALRPFKRAALEARPLARRVCCLRDRLPTVGRCANTCPLVDRDDRTHARMLNG